jgi:hypothetical protein
VRSCPPITTMAMMRMISRPNFIDIWVWSLVIVTTWMIPHETLCHREVTYGNDNYPYIIHPRQPEIEKWMRAWPRTRPSVINSLEVLPGKEPGVAGGMIENQSTARYVYLLRRFVLIQHTVWISKQKVFFLFLARLPICYNLYIVYDRLPICYCTRTPPQRISRQRLFYTSNYRIFCHD